MAAGVAQGRCEGHRVFPEVPWVQLHAIDGGTVKGIILLRLLPILVKKCVELCMEQKIRRDRNMGDNLKRLRKGQHISQEKLCAELQRRGCDIGRTTYAKYEAGELNIRASVLIELKKIYQCSYDEFFLGLDPCENEQ